MALTPPARFCQSYHKVRDLHPVSPSSCGNGVCAPVSVSYPPALADSGCVVHLPAGVAFVSQGPGRRAAQPELNRPDRVDNSPAVG